MVIYQTDGEGHFSKYEDGIYIGLGVESETDCYINVVDMEPNEVPELYDSTKEEFDNKYNKALEIIKKYK